MAAGAFDFSDLGAVPVAQPTSGIDFSDLGGLSLSAPSRAPKRRVQSAQTQTELLPSHAPTTSTPLLPSHAPTNADEDVMPVTGFENVQTPAPIGQVLPQGSEYALAAANRYLVQPFERIAQAGGRIGGNVLVSGLENLPVVEGAGPAAELPPVARGAVRGVGEVIGSTVADPRNWPFFASTAARPILQRVISGGFGLLMGKGAVDAAQDLYRNWDSYSPEQRAQVATQGGLSAVMAAGAATHALRGKPAPNAAAADLGAERVQAEAPQAQPQPAAQPIPAGGQTAVITPSAQIPARYKLAEASDLTPSHDAETFAPNPNYPARVQERAYHTSKEAQARVIQQAQQYDPRYTVNTNPDAVNGPPIVTEDGIVLGGNSRTMSTQRLYSRGQGNVYRDYLRQNAQQFGLDPAQVDQMRNPVLVREVPTPANTDAMLRLGSELNKVPTGALGVSERAVSAGKAISPDTLSNISGMLDQMGSESSIRDLLRERGRDVLSLLVKDGAIADRERPQFVDTATGGLSEEGKTFVERALLGTVVNDPTLMDRVPKSVLNKLDASLAHLASVAPRTDQYNILPAVREALREYADMAQRGQDVETYLGQRGMFGAERSPAVDALVRTLAQKPKDVREAFRSFARDANVDQQGQGFLPMGEQPTPVSAFREAFGPIDFSDLGGERLFAPGPGAKTSGPTEVPGTSLGQLTESLRGRQLSPSDRAGVRIGDSLARMSDRAAEAWESAQSASRELWNRYSQPEAWTDFKDALGKYQGALQHGDWELLKFRNEIQDAIPSKLRREAITNWIQADGNPDVLRERANASNADYRPGYEGALTLTDEERTLANNIRNHFDAKLQEAQQLGMLEHGIENYVNQIWERDNATAQKLRAAAAFHDLQPNPSFLRKRVFDSYFEGEQAGFKPKDKDIGVLVAAYNSAFNRAVASREFIKRLHDATASDGRPLVEVAGSGRRIDTDNPPPNDVQSYFIRPRTKPGEALDYKVIDHPALRSWKWITNDATGHPAFVQGDMLVHPEIYPKLKNILGTSAIRQYAIGRTALWYSAAFKQTLLSLSPFHQVQIGVHALEHTVNPFRAPELDLNNPTQRALVDHGLMVADFHGMSEFSEGVSGTGLVSKIPILGRKMAQYQEYLFRDFIPRVKMAMAEEALARNLARYGDKLNRDQILELTANQANAAFGHLNYKMLARNPTFQDAFRLVALAPDFLEARSRFVGQALKPYGREQLRALALGAVGMAAGKWMIGEITGEKQDWSLNHLFMAKIGGREYGLRTIQGDIIHLLTEPNKFAQYRLNPALTRPLLEGLYGRDPFGRQRSGYEQLKDYFTTAVPIPLKGAVVKGPQDIVDTILQSTGVQSRKYKPTPAGNLPKAIQRRAATNTAGR